ncbi:MAG: hypothetical protein WAN65_17500 [Candidatus Sulfotelmatobacter sp.]
MCSIHFVMVRALVIAAGWLLLSVIGGLLFGAFIGAVNRRCQGPEDQQ